MRKTILAIIGFSVVLGLTGLSVNHAAAIETSGIGALPAHPHLDNPRTKSIFIYDVAAGDELADGIRVVNNTDTTKTLEVYPVDSQASSDGAFACAQKVDPRQEVGSWVKLSQSQVTLHANSNQVVPFTLTLPGSVKAGEHDGCIVVQDAAPAAQKQKAGNGIVLSFRSALRVSVTTPGSLSADLSFVDVKTRDINRTTLGVSPILKNTGDVSADANIDVRLTGILGFHYGFANIGGQFPTFPNAESRFNFEVKKPFWGGWYNRDIRATYKKPLASGQLSDNVTTIRAKNSIIFIVPQPLALVIEASIALALATIILHVARKLWLIRRLRQMSTDTYTVQPGDTIESIASHYTITWQQLARINDIKSPYTLHAGKVIKVPSSPHAESGSPKQDPPAPDKPSPAPPTADSSPTDPAQGTQTPVIG